MKISFLAGDLPLTKQYKMVDGVLEKEAYPNVFEFTSYTHELPNITHLYEALKVHASRNHCLLKGTLSRELVSESRAGTTDSIAPTEFICLDIDGLQHVTDVSAFLNMLGLPAVDYIAQYSSSMGIEPDKGLSAHIFMLCEPIVPALLKQWLLHINLSLPVLTSQIRLTKTNFALRYPVDISTCQNDKLIYIAPPILGEGVEDHFEGDRIRLIKRDLRVVPFSSLTIPDVSVTRIKVDTHINVLRASTGLPERKIAYKIYQNEEYLAKPDPAIITGIRHDRGFVYFNFNNGNSWGYYHPEATPEFIHNFKGEPIYRTRELLPEYWASLQTQAAPTVETKEGLYYLAFRDFKSAAYYNGVYDKPNNKLTLAVAKGENQLRHFMEQNGRTLTSYVPDWELTFDPSSTERVNIERKVVNTYVPSEYRGTTLVPKAKLPPIINRVITNAVAADPATKTHFLNWLADIIQNNAFTMTAWALSGTQGTGKGVLYNRIIAPLVGIHQCTMKRLSEFESQFTGYLENTQIVFIDEVQVAASKKTAEIMANLKNMIVEPTLSVRKMHHEPYMTKNHCNFIFASNFADPVLIDPSDRRFNVGEYQNKKLSITLEEVEEGIAKELPEFYSYLMQYKVDRIASRTALQNDAKRLLINISRNSIDLVSDALLNGDISFFWDAMPTSDPNRLDPIAAMRHIAYADIIRSIVRTGEEESKLNRDDLRVIYDYCIGNVPTSPNKFTSLLKHHGIHLKPIKQGGRLVRGIEVKWFMDQEWLLQVQEEIENEGVHQEEPKIRLVKT